MKKFKFSLQKVLEYQEHICQNEKEYLAMLRVQLIELVQTELQLKAKLAKCREEYLEDCEKGVSAIAAAVASIYMKELREQIESQRERISEKEKEIEKQTEKLVEATKDKTKYEKLRQTKLTIYNAKEAKAQELLIEELVAYKNSVQTAIV